jgi:hypothetical protein
MIKSILQLKKRIILYVYTLAPLIIFLQPLVPVKDTQTGTGWNTAAAQKQIDLLPEPKAAGR